MTKLEPEYKDTYTAWTTTPNKKTTGALLRAVDPVISNALRSYGGGKPSPMLRSKAKQLAVQSFASYDPTRGSLRGHMLSRLQRLRRIAGSERQIIRVPEQVSLDQMRTSNASVELHDKLGRPPSDQELADHTGLSVRRLGYIRQGQRPLAEGTVSQRIAESAGFDPAIKPMQTTNDAYTEFVYDELDPTNQYIMERTLGLHGHPRQSAVQLAKELKMTSSAISHRMKYIQQQFDELEDLGGF